MIVPMREVLLFSSVRSVDETVLKLGQLGVLDMQKVNFFEDETVERSQEALYRTEKVIETLKDFAKRKNYQNSYLPSKIKDPKRLISRILKTGTIKENCLNQLKLLDHQLLWYKIWGNELKVNDFVYLRSRGIHLRFYILEKSVVKRLRKKHLVFELPARKGKIPTILISRNQNEKLDKVAWRLPDLSLTQVKKQIKRKKRQLSALKNYLENQVGNLKFLETYHLYLKDRLLLQQARAGSGDIEGKLCYFKGFLPKEAVEDFVQTADVSGWGYSISEPEKPEEVPVYIKNPRWISIIDPVLKFIDIVPGYKEVDVSIYFLVAFTLFFGMLVGDAGYGLLFLLVTLLFRKKIPSKTRFLLYVLSVATLVWGVLSGTYFGAEEIAELPLLKAWIIPEMASFGEDNIGFMMHFSFLVGAIHLTIAHGVRGVQYMNSLKVLGELGWIALVWSLFLVAEQLVLDREMPQWGMGMLIGGAVLVSLFSVVSKNLLSSIGISLANLPLGLVSGFSDIVSYVRLCAVGMATAAVAASFNQMILPEGISEMGFTQLILASLALLLGHGLNIALALMAVMVHGIRLNMLEFAGHLGVQFSGEAYRPFKLNFPEKHKTVSDKMGL